MTDEDENADAAIDAVALLWLEKHLAEAREWLCECGQQCDPSASDWRWNGDAWEHQHGYPLGYVSATRKTITADERGCTVHEPLACGKRATR